MPSVKRNTTIKEYQDFTQEVYGLSNDRYFSAWDMLSNVERFTMRGLKGIRKSDVEKTKTNLLISLSWFMSLMNQLHIDVEKEIWERFPGKCSYCQSCPCICKSKKMSKRKEKISTKKKTSKTLEDFQRMFEEIYPSNNRTLEHAGVHLAEEIGELSEAMLTYRGSHMDADFKQVALEIADFFSCFAGVFNSMKISIAKELEILFSENCHVCKKAPCECSFADIIKYKS